MYNFFKIKKPRFMIKYYKSKKLGEGTYAVIYLAHEILVEENDKQKFVKEKPENLDSLKKVAIKKIKKTEYSQGVEVSAIREIKALKNIEDKYTLGILDIFNHKNSTHIVLEYIDYDLEFILKNKSILIMPGDIKSWMYMLLKGVKACHDKSFIHRDIKPNNILIGKDGILKLADFGLTRRLADRMTPSAVTRWYRSPEMLLGAKSYGYAVDMWSVGAVFAEMFLRIPFFPGETDIQQIDLICQVIGTSKTSILSLKTYPPQNLKNIFTAASSDAIDLLKRLLDLDPETRITAKEALKHPYFKNLPHATIPSNLPLPQ